MYSRLIPLHECNISNSYRGRGGQSLPLLVEMERGDQWNELCLFKLCQNNRDESLTWMSSFSTHTRTQRERERKKTVQKEEKKNKKKKKKKKISPLYRFSYVNSFYLGLLSGGQIIKRIAKRTLGLNSEKGLAVFCFDADNNKLQLKSFVKDRINSLELTREEKDNILREKIKCFRMNNAIADAIQPSLASYRRIFVMSLFLLGFILVLVLMLYQLCF